jgi:gluconolactonase
MRQLANTEPEYLKKVRRAYLNEGLSMAQLTVTTNFGVPPERQAAEIERTREAVRVGLLLGAPVVRIFAGAPPRGSDRGQAFERAAASVRQVCEEAANVGMPLGLQNHNHGALCRTGDEVLRFLKLADHPNLVFVLDTGQFAGSRGASGPVPADLKDADYLASIRATASLARHVRVKFYRPRADGSEPFLEYDKILNILSGVHYPGFLDIVYEPPAGGEDATKAIPRVVRFLRGQLARVEVQAPPAGPVGRYEGVETGKYLLDKEPRTESSVAFLEGPAVARDGTVYFTNTDAERIMRWEPRQRRATVYRENSNGANGMRFDRQGRLVVCEGGGRVTRTDLKTGQSTVLADTYEGKPLGAPNDVEIDGQGRIYFTSRFGKSDPQTGRVNGVYRIDPEGKISRILAAPAIDMPNGIATSPDDKILFLIDADGRENHARRIRAYDLKPDGTVANERLLYDFYPGRSGDGMRIDAEGNLYVAAGLHRRRGNSETLDTRPGIHVLSPQGKLVDFLATPEDTITNCAFGGADLRTLYVTCGKLLLSIRTRIPGKGSYRPEV